jgi:hypothetical protein
MRFTLAFIFVFAAMFGHAQYSSPTLVATAGGGAADSLVLRNRQLLVAAKR